MGTLASLGMRTNNATAGTAYFEIIAPTVKPVTIHELMIVSAANAGHTLCFGRPGVKGNPSSTTLFQTNDPADPAVATAYTNVWSALQVPTIPEQFHRRWNATGIIGGGVIWTWPNGFVIKGNLTAVMWVISGTTACDVNIAVEE